MATAFYGAPVELFVPLVELVDLSTGDEFLIKCWPCFFVESGKNHMRPRLALRFRVWQQVHATVWMCATAIAAQGRRGQNYAQPTEVVLPRDALWHGSGP